MSKWFRSAKMKYLSLTFSEDVGHSLIDGLGLIGSIQFTDVYKYLKYS